MCSQAAIVISDDHYNGLGVIRSLGEKNIPVILLIFENANRSKIISKSKYIVQTIDISRNKDDIIKAANIIAKDFDQVFLFPVSDYGAQVCDEFRNSFSEKIITPHAGGQLSSLENKYIMSQIAQANRVLCPKHIVINTKPETEIEWSIYPAIIKPLLSIEGKKTDIVIVQDSDDLKRELSNLYHLGYHRVLLEQYVHGHEEYMIEILGCTDGNGTIELSNLIRKVREYPILNGSTSFATILNSNDLLNIQDIKKMINATKFSGLFDLEFKYSDGLIYFIEMNFRNGAPSYALTQRGFNIPFTWLSMMTNKSYQICFNNHPQYLMCETYDLTNALKGHVGIIQWFSDFKKARLIIWDSNDIFPSIGFYLSIFKSVFRKILHH